MWVGKILYNKMPMGSLSSLTSKNFVSAVVEDEQDR